MKTAKRNPQQTPPALPTTPRGWALWHARKNCEMGKEGLDSGRGVPADCEPMEWAVYQLLCAVEELARAMECDN